MWSFWKSKTTTTTTTTEPTVLESVVSSIGSISENTLKIANKTAAQFGAGNDSIAGNGTTSGPEAEPGIPLLPKVGHILDLFPEPGLSDSSNPSDPDGSQGMSTTTAIVFGLILSLIFVLIVSLILFVATRRKDQKKKKSLPKEEENESESDSLKAHSLVSDLPSTDVQSIHIENKELKPVKSQVFEWQSNAGQKQKPKNKVIDNKNKKKDKPKEKDKPKDKPKDKIKDKKNENKGIEKKDDKKKVKKEEKKDKENTPTIADSDNKAKAEAVKDNDKQNKK